MQAHHPLSSLLGLLLAPLLFPDLGFRSFWRSLYSFAILKATFRGFSPPFNLVGSESLPDCFFLRILRSRCFPVAADGIGRNPLMISWWCDRRKVMGDASGAYVRLPQTHHDESIAGMWGSFVWWMKVVFLCIVLAAAAAALVIFAGPLVIRKVVVPILDWETATFRTPDLGLLIFASIAFFPAIFLPSSPSMWIAGMTFGYGYGFMLIMAGASIGMSLPYLIGSSFRNKIHKWLERWPNKSAIIRLAGEGDWLHQFRAVTLIRISPFPYIVFNYASVATNVKYCPYICGSLVGSVPDIFITIYSGRLLRTLADATTDTGGILSLQQVIYDVLGFSVALAATVAITIYAKRTLQTLQVEDELCHSERENLPNGS